MHSKDFQFYRPCQALQPYVRYYWAFRSDQMLNALTFPIGCPQIIFHKKVPLYVPELDACQHKLTVSGQVNYPAHLCTRGDTEMIVVVFQPHAMKTFLDLPISLLHNQEISGYDLGNKRLHELAAQVFDCEDTGSCIRIIEQRLLSQITHTPAYPLKRISTALQQLLATPDISVNELAAIACLSKKQFERLFNAMVGANPKEYARITRFQKALSFLQHSPETMSQAQIAYQCGYADQSHFIREFKQFSGHTPLSLLKTGTPYSDLFSQPV